jgi:hypothetical protein
MGYFYFDESIHDGAGFIIGAYVYSERDITPLVVEAVRSAGLEPGVDEFKSRSMMKENPRQVILRGSLKKILRRETKIGLVVAPRSDRETLGSAALNCLEKIVISNDLTTQAHSVYFDQGIRSPRDFPREISQRCEIYFGQDSKRCAGIQMADLAAHTLASMLLEELGFLKKNVRAGENSGYDPDTEMNIGFELWADLRQAFFMTPFSNEQMHSEDIIESATYDVSSCGLYITPTCSDALRQAAEKRFGSCYLGCIH